MSKLWKRKTQREQRALGLFPRRLFVWPALNCPREQWTRVAPGPDLQKIYSTCFFSFSVSPLSLSSLHSRERAFLVLNNFNFNCRKFKGSFQTTLSWVDPGKWLDNESRNGDEGENSAAVTYTSERAKAGSSGRRWNTPKDKNWIKLYFVDLEVEGSRYKWTGCD